MSGGRSAQTTGCRCGIRTGTLSLRDQGLCYNMGMKKMTRKLQLMVFCETAEAYFNREIAEIKRRDDEHGVEIGALRRLRKAVRDSVAALDGGPYPASFRVNLTFACPKGMDREVWSCDIRSALWEVVSGVEYALFNDNWLMGLSSNIIHSHYQIDFRENGRSDIAWKVVLKDIRRPNPLMRVWVEDAESDRGGYEKCVRLWTTDADNLPLFGKTAASTSMSRSATLKSCRSRRA